MVNRWFESLLGFFFKDSPRVPDLELECTINIDRVAEELAIESTATRSAEHELPPTEGEKPDDAEHKIHAYIQKRMSDVTNIANEKLTRYNTAISDTNLNDETARIQNIASNAKLRLKNLMSEAEDTLNSLKGDRNRLATQLTTYKKMHGLKNRDAEYPSSRTLHYSLVAIMLVFESIMNGYFFARGANLGLLGGITQSMVVAALNILSAFSIAGLILLRYMNYVVTWKRSLAYVFLVIYGAWAGIFNLIVAHYRDLLKSNPKEAIALTLDKFVDAPFHLIDLDSWLLFFVGILFALFAAYDGYKSDDPYPHFGDKQRKLYESDEIYREECFNLVKNAANIRETFLEELDSLSTSVKDSYTHLFHLAQQKKALIEKHKHCITDFQSAGSALIQRYRTANLMKRTTEAPAYFKNGWKLDRDYQLVGVCDDSEKLNEQKHVYEGFPRIVQETSNEIELVYREVFEMLQAIEPSIKPPGNIDDK